MNEEKAFDDMVVRVDVLRKALKEIQERADRGGRRLETAMQACDEIEEMAKQALDLTK